MYMENIATQIVVHGSHCSFYLPPMLLVGVPSKPLWKFSWHIIRIHRRVEHAHGSYRKVYKHKQRVFLRAAGIAALLHFS
jgi:hypothetical protein